MESCGRRFAEWERLKGVVGWDRETIQALLGLVVAVKRLRQTEDRAPTAPGAFAKMSPSIPDGLPVINGAPTPKWNCQLFVPAQILSPTRGLTSGLKVRIEMFHRNMLLCVVRSLRTEVAQRVPALGVDKAKRTPTSS